jgi:hypothetical protein
MPPFNLTTPSGVAALDRGPQNLHYDFWWNLPRDYMVSSEWALLPQFENGIVPRELLLVVQTVRGYPR